MKRNVRLSIQWRLPLLMGGTILIAIVALSSAAFLDVRSALRDAAGVRLGSITGELAGVIEAQAQPMISQARALARDRTVTAFLASRTPRRGDSARVARRIEQATPLPAVGLLDRRGRVIVAAGPAARRVRTLLDTLALRSDSGAIGRMMAGPDSVVYTVVAPVVDRRVALGHVVQWRSLTNTQRSQRAYQEMIGGRDAALYLGNRDGSVWMDLVHVVRGPPESVLRQDGVQEYGGRGAGRRLAYAQALAGTPWVVVVEMSLQSVDAPALAFLRRLAAMAAALVALGMLGAWYLSRGITQPLAELTSIAEGAAAGDFSRHSEIVRQDELGRLARVFNAMADRISTTVANLSDSESRYRTLFESNPHPMWVVDRETLRFLAVNAAAIEHYGYSEAEFLTMTPADIRPPEDVPAFLESMQGPDASMRLTAGWRHRKRDGTVVEVEVSAHDVTFGGRPAQVVLVTDVSDRHRAEAALRESEARFRQVTEHINEAFYLVDLVSSTPLYVSPTWSAIWGRPIADAYDQKVWLDAIHPDDRGGVRASQQRVASGEPAVDSFRVLRPDGSVRWVRGRIFPVRDPQGRIYRMVGVAEDVTELRRAREQTVQAQRIEGIGRLAGGVAHDFNNLLTVIMGHIELLQLDLPPDSALGGSVQEVKSAAERAGALTRQLLAFSRRQMVEPTTFLLNDLVADLLKMLRRLIGEDIEVVTRMAPDTGAVRADRAQIEQVLINLAVNARDAMPGGGGLSIETGNVTLDEAYAKTQDDVTPGDYVMLAVTDSGTGMSDDVKAKIFEPFFTTKAQGKGTGLGLATSYGIVKQSGGHISVYSELGLGTTMKVYLPQAVGKISQEMPAQRAPLPRGSETVLLVEDEKGVRDVATRILTAQGYKVVSAADGEEAIRLATPGASIDLLLTDVVMPRMGGRELADRITADRPGLKVLFSTGYTDDTILQDRLAQHGVKVIQKPFTRETLARKVREVLDAS